MVCDLQKTVKDRFNCYFFASGASNFKVFTIREPPLLHFPQISGKPVE